MDLSKVDNFVDALKNVFSSKDHSHTSEDVTDFYRNVFYGTCATTAATAAKVVTTDSDFQLKIGVIIGVKFSISNTASNVTLNVNGTGAKQIWYGSSAYSNNNSYVTGSKDMTTFYMYNGAYWVYVTASYLYMLPVASSTRTGGVRVGNNLTIDSSTATLSATNMKNTYFCTCSTSASTSAKVITTDSDFILRQGVIIAVKSTVSNTASNVTLNVNGTGAKQIWYGSSVYTSTEGTVCGYANRTLTYIYDGTYWVYTANGLVDSNTTTGTETTIEAGVNDTKFATRQSVRNYVDDAIDNIDFEDYYTKSEINDIIHLILQEVFTGTASDVNIIDGKLKVTRFESDDL